MVFPKESKQIHRVDIQTPADFLSMTDTVDIGDEFAQAML